MKTAVGAPAPPPSMDEIITAISKMSMAEYLVFRERLREMLRDRENRRKLQ